MPESTRSIQLSAPQAGYLGQATWLTPRVREALGPGTREIELTAQIADELQAELTARLAKVGFAKNYEPTPEGAMLEDLIDALGA